MESLPADPNPFADWSAHLFTANRRQYIITTNTPTLYTMIMYGGGITTDAGFIAAFRNELSSFLQYAGIGFVFERCIEPQFEQVHYSKSLNRSVTGSMNDLIYLAKVYLEEGMSVSDVSLHLNQAPMSYIKYLSPAKLFGMVIGSIDK